MAGVTSTLIFCALAVLLGATDAAYNRYQGAPAPQQQYQGYAQGYSQGPAPGYGQGYGYGFGIPSIPPAIQNLYSNPLISSVLQSYPQLVTSLMQTPIDSNEIQRIITEGTQMMEKLFALPSDDVRNAYYKMLAAAIDSDTEVTADTDVLTSPIYKDILTKDCPVYKKLASDKTLKSEIQQLIANGVKSRQTMAALPEAVKYLVNLSMHQYIESLRARAQNGQ